MRGSANTTRLKPASVLEARLRSFLEEHGPSSAEELIECFLGKTTGNRELASAVLHGYLRDHPQLFARRGSQWILVKQDVPVLPACDPEVRKPCLLLIEKGPLQEPFSLGLVREGGGVTPSWLALRVRNVGGRVDFLVQQDTPNEDRRRVETAEQAAALMQRFAGGGTLWYLGRSADLLRARRFWDPAGPDRPLPLWPAARRLLGLPAAIRPGALARALGMPEYEDDGESPAARLVWWLEALRQLCSRLAAEGLREPAEIQRWLSAPANTVDFNAFGFVRADLLAVPEQPGIYCFRDRSGQLLYVGKAKNLRRRILSYFQPGSAARARKRFLLTKIHSFEYHSLRSDLEALVSESRLIQEFEPAFNVQQSVRSPQAGYFAMNPAIAVFPCPDRENTLELWCLCPGRNARQLVFKDTAKDLMRLRRALSRIFGRPAKRRNLRQDSQSLLVASWLFRNRQTANWIDVEKFGGVEEILRQLQGYSAAGANLSSQRIVFR